MPTRRAIALAALGLVPAVLAVVSPTAGWLVLAFDVLLLAMVGVDWLRAPRSGALTVVREVEPVISAGRPHAGPAGALAEAGRAAAAAESCATRCRPGRPRRATGSRFELGEAPVTLTWWLTSLDAGRSRAPRRAPAALRPAGAWRRGRRGWRCRRTVKIYPDLTALTRDALALARAREDESRRSLRRIAEGREFESLREYRPGDDRRHHRLEGDRAARPADGARAPARSGTRRCCCCSTAGGTWRGTWRGGAKLDHAVDAALRVAKVSLDEGDLVGVMAFSTQVLAWLPPRKGPDAMARHRAALYRCDATLDESDYGKAFDTAFARGSKRRAGAGLHRPARRRHLGGR